MNEQYRQGIVKIDACFNLMWFGLRVVSVVLLSHRSDQSED